MADNCYQIENIAPGFRAINEGGVRMYLLEGEDLALLIDTGFGGGDLRGTVAELTRKPVRVFVTHDHHDHISGCGQFDSFILHEQSLAAVRAKSPADAEFTLVGDGDVIDLGGWRLTVLHTPGHTAGSLSLRDEEHDIIFSGDGVGDRPVFTFLDGADLDAYENSLVRLAALAGDDTVFYTCHGTMTKKADTAERLVCCCEGIRRGLIPEDIQTLYTGEQHRVFRYKDVAVLY